MSFACANELGRSAGTQRNESSLPFRRDRLSDLESRSTSHMGPKFQRRVTSIGLFDYLDWVQASAAGISRIPDPLTLPPVQRSALWGPNKILDLWRSLLAGMPVGAFYLAPPGAKRRLIGNADGRGETTDEVPEGMGYDLLDGQQRTNAMLLALLSPAQAGKCVWIAPSAEDGEITVRLTTGSQPFGFTEKDEKLRSYERKAARAALENDHGEAEGSFKGISDHKLYGCHIKTSPDGWPPPPHLPDPGGRTRPPVAPLHALIAALRATSPDGVPLEQRLEALFAKSTTPIQGDCVRRHITSAEIATVRHALAALEEAEIALILAAPPPPALDKLTDPDWTLKLFDRIGANGTPLVGAERLFSIYKHHAPYVHDAVMDIEKHSGRIMTPVEIAATAIGIAATGNKRPSFASPEPREFGRWMKSPDLDHKDFQERLRLLIPQRKKGAPGGTLAPAFFRVRLLLMDEQNPRSLPPLLMTKLRPELLRILVHWAVLTGDRADSAALDASMRDDVVRFALFWHLCVTKPDRAGARAMACLTEWARASGLEPRFPWKKLVDALVGEDPLAVQLVHPGLVERYGKHLQPSSKLRSWAERLDRVIKEEGFDLATQDLFRRWWEASDILLWLQRGYFKKEFRDHDPFSEREEDNPVDLDHIQPQAEFGFHFNAEERRFEDKVRAERKAFQDWRWLLGNSIGNYRWVSSSVNRADGDCPIREKLGLDNAAPLAPSRPSLEDCRITPESRAFWNRASSPSDQRWTTDRILVWQQVVEERAVRLYEEFWREADFKAWFGDTPLADRVHSSSDAA